MPPVASDSAAPWTYYLVAFAEKAAASVYHEVIAVQPDVTLWKQDNPAITALVQKGVDLANKLLMACGLPTRDFDLVTRTVDAALRELAAHDPTIQSGNSTRP